MKKLSFLTTLLSLAPFLASAFAGSVTVNKDTYGVFNKEDFPVILQHDQATLEALVEQHKCILVPQGTEGFLLDEIHPPKSVIFRPATNQEIRVFLLVSDVSAGGKPIEMDNFQVSDLLRVPTHRPRTEAEQGLGNIITTSNTPTILSLQLSAVEPTFIPASKKPSAVCFTCERSEEVTIGGLTALTRLFCATDR
jgi:hypothetical protein